MQPHFYCSLATRGADFGDGSTYITYWNVGYNILDLPRFLMLNLSQQVILSIISIPGVLLTGYMVELPFLGQRGTLSISTCTFEYSLSESALLIIILNLVLTGVFILASTTAWTSNALLRWNLAYNLTSNVMYSVLFALTPKFFPTKDRAMGNALTASANRVFSVMVCS